MADVGVPTIAGMDESALTRALRHDAAQKKAAGNENDLPDQTEIEADVLLESLELKQAALAKTVAMSFTDMSRACVGLALSDLQGEGDNFNEATIKALLDFSERALKLAEAADLLGDRAAARLPKG